MIFKPVFDSCLSSSTKFLHMLLFLNRSALVCSVTQESKVLTSRYNSTSESLAEVSFLKE